MHVQLCQSCMGKFENRTMRVFSGGLFKHQVCPLLPPLPVCCVVWARRPPAQCAASPSPSTCRAQEHQQQQQQRAAAAKQQQQQLVQAVAAARGSRPAASLHASTGGDMVDLLRGCGCARHNHSTARSQCSTKLPPQRLALRWELRSCRQCTPHFPKCTDLRQTELDFTCHRLSLLQVTLPV